MQQAKTCHMIKCKGSYLGVNSKVLGFMRYQDAHLVKRAVQQQPVKLHEHSDVHVSIQPIQRRPDRPLHLSIEAMDNVITSIFFTKVNNVDLLLIDEVQKENTTLHCFSNFTISVDIDPAVQVDQLNDIFHDIPIHYESKLAELIAEDDDEDED